MVALIYGQTYNYGFAFDDHGYILENPLVQSFDKLI